jgi:hypothetical protein
VARPLVTFATPYAFVCLVDVSRDFRQVAARSRKRRAQLGFNLFQLEVDVSFPFITTELQGVGGDFV